VASMQVYNDYNNGCIAGDCIVLMADGSRKEVRLVTKGDRVMAPNRRAALVICVVKTHCHQSETELVRLKGGLLVTPYHPVRIEDKWHFPCDLAPSSRTPCAAVYSFVLDHEHVMLINGIECITLGHNFMEEVARHPYFGTHCVVDDLKNMRGWPTGMVEFSTAKGCLVRDKQNGLVCGLENEVLLAGEA